jgi:hypothetical protein
MGRHSAAMMFTIRATYLTTLQATPIQLVVGRDSILNTEHEANWAFIQQRKQLSLIETIQNKTLHK